MESKKYPVFSPVLGDLEKQYLAKCIEDQWISSDGPFVRQLEKEFPAFIGIRNSGCAVSNGTAALETALFALGVKPGDEVIIPDFTIISCAIACIRLGAVPVPVDCEPEHFVMDPEKIEAAVSSKTKVVMAVHIYGASVDFSKLLELQKKYGFMILEDIAEAIGTRYEGRLCGSIGNAAAVSFYANKLVTAGEGGMVLSHDPQTIQRARAYRNLCFGSMERFRHEEIGYNFRMTNMQAAIACASLQKAEANIEKKNKIATWYRNCLQGIPGIQFLDFPSYNTGVYWMFCVHFIAMPPFSVNELIMKLNDRGIGCRPFFKGMHEQPALNGYLRLCGDYRNSSAAYRSGFYLPSSCTLSSPDVEYIVEQFKKTLSMMESRY